MNIPEIHIQALKIILKELSDMDVPWCITGSLGLAVQGVDVSINDIDIQSTKRGVYEIQTRLEEFIIKSVTWKVSDKIRSYFGRCQIEGVIVELIGDIQKRGVHGTWIEPPDLTSLICTVEHGDLMLPVLDLEYEAQAYEYLGRFEKSRKIKEAMLKRLNLES
jgi:hypothetical protein